MCFCSVLTVLHLLSNFVVNNQGSVTNNFKIAMHCSKYMRFKHVATGLYISQFVQLWACLY